MSTGSVVLVGGGPGAEDLITVGGAKALLDAEVVLYDRLAPHESLQEMAPNAELIFVGKRPGHHAISQTEIERLMVEHALLGKRVVRLKGGDPYVFGRGSEEVLACNAAGVPVRVVSGVTSAVSVPAAAGIPLTHRGVSHMFTVVSGHAPLSDNELLHLAGLGSTIVVLMGVATLVPITQGLVKFGASPETPVAVIERGYSPTQTTTISTLANIVTDAALAKVDSPAVLVIGEVVRLAHDGNADAAELYARAQLLAGAP